ncbi:MAG TPA: class I SAM-dependent methyltransferase [Steroidobacteraceae bacterium]|nr:class I SAM-dependent methyltransferase [Steroidobacteraceae bacterium]
MNTSNRCVLPEALDNLAADDPRGMRSRRDLQRVHRAMRSVAILLQAVARLRLGAPPVRILELGAGDGTLLLRFARALRPRWSGVELTLLDRHELVSDQTRKDYRDLGWRVTPMRADALEWAAEPRHGHYDLCFANLFLHHFDPAALAALLRAVAAATDAFVACEPRRSGFSRVGSRLVALLGANEITRDDAVKSVAAGFTGLELSLAWGRGGSDWRVEEFLAPPFTHCFAAVRARARTEGGAHGL